MSSQSASPSTSQGAGPGTTSQPGGAALTALSPDQFGTLLPFIPDTPWTTTPIHALQRKQGRAFVDSLLSPKNVVIVACGEPATRTLDRAFLFGSARSEALKQFVASLRVPTEIVCDGDVADIVREHHPEARMKQSIVFWYDECGPAQSLASEPGAKRVRISESDSIAPLIQDSNLRTFRTVRELVTGGSAFAVEAEGQIAAAAVTVDHSVKYERFTAVTRDAFRRGGRGTMVARRLVKCIADQNRLPCAIVERTDAAGLALASKLGFTQQAQMRSFTTRLKSL